jgi:NADPH:quinone reductase
LDFASSFTEPQGVCAAMKAIRYERFGGPEVLQYLDLPDPTPGPRELLIETVAIGVNFPDIRERLGIYNKAETRVGGVQLPQVGGLAVAGTVVAAGPQTSVEVGRKVVALMKKGAYAQLALAEEALCAVLDSEADNASLAVLAGFAGQAVSRCWCTVRRAVWVALRCRSRRHSVPRWPSSGGTCCSVPPAARGSRSLRVVS